MDARSAEWGQGAGMGLRGPVPDRLGTGGQLGRPPHPQGAPCATTHPGFSAAPLHTIPLATFSIALFLSPPLSCEP